MYYFLKSKKALFIVSILVITVLANEDNGYTLSLEHAFGEGMY